MKRPALPPQMDIEIRFRKSWVSGIWNPKKPRFTWNGEVMRDKEAALTIYMWHKNGENMPEFPETEPPARRWFVGRYPTPEAIL